MWRAGAYLWLVQLSPFLLGLFRRAPVATPLAPLLLRDRNAARLRRRPRFRLGRGHRSTPTTQLIPGDGGSVALINTVAGMLARTGEGLLVRLPGTESATGRSAGRRQPEHLVVVAVAGGDVQGAVRAGAHGA